MTTVNPQGLMGRLVLPNPIVLSLDQEGAKGRHTAARVQAYEQSVGEVRLRVEHKSLNVSAPVRTKLEALENSHQTLEVTTLSLLSKSHLKFSLLSNQWSIARRKEFLDA